MKSKTLNRLIVAANITLLAAGSYLACRRPSLEERIERWHRMEYCEAKPGKKEDGLGAATDALFEARLKGDFQTAAALERVVKRMMRNRDNGKRDLYCEQMKSIRGATQQQ